MTDANACRWLLIATMLWLGACAHTPGADEIAPGARFETKILADATKLFTYRQRFMRGDLEALSYAAVDEERSRREREAARAAAPKAARRGLETLLARNRYCRDGYVVLEQYEQQGSYIIRGECRDAATNPDRDRFSPP